VTATTNTNRGTGTGTGTNPRQPSPAPPRARHRLRLFVVGAVLVGAVVFLLAEGLSNSLDYFDTVNQALTQKATLGTSNFRLEGTVVPGSIRNTAVGTDFTVSGGGHAVPVENTGSPPELFQPGIPVVAVGHFASAGSTVFLSNQILVKHSASYIAQHPARVRASNGSTH
jgi:cytochrome c-type biogenesis protein CcmE